jgi:hypothetical protein
MNQNTNTTNVDFTPGQLALVHTVAVQCDEPDSTSRTSNEWAVFTTLRDFCSGFTADELLVMHLIAKECEKRNLGAMKVHECIAEFARIYRGEDLGQLPSLAGRAISACLPLQPFVMLGGRMLTPRTGNPGFMGPFSLN